MKAKRAIFIPCAFVLWILLVSGCTTVPAEKSCWTDPTIEPADDMPLAQKIALAIWWPLQGIAYGMAGGRP